MLFKPDSEPPTPLFALASFCITKEIVVKNVIQMSATGGCSQLQRHKQQDSYCWAWNWGMGTDLQPWVKGACHAKNSRGLGTSCSPGTILISDKVFLLPKDAAQNSKSVGTAILEQNRTSAKRWSVVMIIGLSAPLVSYWDWHHPRNLVFVGKQGNFCP